MSVKPQYPEKQTEPMTVSEYKALEQETDTKYEYHEGWVTAQVGGSIPHAKLSTRIARGLGNALDEKGSDCEVLNSEAKLYIVSANSYVYPDSMVVCGSIEVADEDKDAFVNPTLIVEVLSPTTEGYDRGKKFAKYRQIPSLKEYLLMAQDEPTIELYTRISGDSSWQYTTVSDIDQEFTLNSLGISLSLSWLYRDIDLEAFSEDISS